MLIGILTFHNEINHGAFLQTYCLQETLKRMGNTVDIINYSSPFYLRNHNNAIRYTCFRLRNYRHRSYRYNAISTLIKEIKFRYARQTKLSTTQFSEDINYIIRQKKYDLIILGSDEIWNFENLGRGLDLAYFGKGIDKCRIISYACSFGNISLNQAIPGEVVNNLKKISSISVRDNNSLSIVNSVSLNAQKVLDPTFLYHVNPFHTQRSKNIENYILIYAVDLKPETVKIIQDYSRKNGLKILALSYQQSWADINIIDAGVFEWLSFFEKAEIVITNTFHGTIFSILNQRQFCVAEMGNKSIKIKDLLEELGLLQQIAFSSTEIPEILSKTIDYTPVISTIELLKTKSMDFLNKELEDCSVK